MNPDLEREIRRAQRERLENHLLFQIRAAGLPEPVRQLQFDPKRRWRFDFSWQEPRLAVEVQGGTWTLGGHSRGKGYEADCRKANAAVLLGWHVLRFTTDMIESGEALSTIEAALTAGGFPLKRES